MVQMQRRCPRKGRPCNPDLAPGRGGCVADGSARHLALSLWPRRGGALLVPRRAASGAEGSWRGGLCDVDRCVAGAANRLGPRLPVGVERCLGDVRAVARGGRRPLGGEPGGGHRRPASRGPRGRRARAATIAARDLCVGAVGRSGHVVDRLLADCVLGRSVVCLVVVAGRCPGVVVGARATQRRAGVNVRRCGQHGVGLLLRSFGEHDQPRPGPLHGAHRSFARGRGLSPRALDALLRSGRRLCARRRFGAAAPGWRRAAGVGPTMSSAVLGPTVPPPRAG
mmetsp:Transcript_98544/g.284334  ORF Transcript_98544/g.284334 Transcript_98544/m.284334 type:complete len:282 (-) Transcript_98544:21-866(-)